MIAASPHESPPAAIRRSKRLIRKFKPITDSPGPVSDFEAVVASYGNFYSEWMQSRHQASVALGQQHEAEAALDQELRGVGLAILTVDRGRRSSEIYRRTSRTATAARCGWTRRSPSRSRPACSPP